MTAPSFERFGQAWADATALSPVDEQRSLVRLLESLEGERVAQPWGGRTAWFLAAATLLVTLGVGGYAYQRPNSKVMPVDRAVAAGAWLETRRDQQLPVRFSEGSEMEVAGSSRVRVGGDSPEGAQVTVEHGRVRAKIVHRKNTRWAFAAGPFNVRVTGTVLEVDWRPETGEFRVAVDEGSVVAQGPMLGTGHEIRQGQVCRVKVKTSEVTCSSSTSVASPSVQPMPSSTALGNDIEQLPLVDDATEVVHEKPRLEGSRPQSSLLELERSGKYAEALARAEKLGLEKLLGQGSAEELLCLSRLGRYQDRPRLARDALVKLRDRFCKTQAASHAAFLLGRQAAPSEAARWFSIYLEEQPQGAFAREASGRLVESLRSAGRASEAQAAARRYLETYPTGPHAGFAKSLLANP